MPSKTVLAEVRKSITGAKRERNNLLKAQLAWGTDDDPEQLEVLAAEIEAARRRVKVLWRLYFRLRDGEQTYHRRRREQAEHRASMHASSGEAAHG